MTTPEYGIGTSLTEWHNVINEFSAKETLDSRDVYTLLQTKTRILATILDTTEERTALSTCLSSWEIRPDKPLAYLLEQTAAATETNQAKIAQVYRKACYALVDDPASPLRKDNVSPEALYLLVEKLHEGDNLVRLGYPVHSRSEYIREGIMYALTFCVSKTSSYEDAQLAENAYRTYQSIVDMLADTDLLEFDKAQERLLRMKNPTKEAVYHFIRCQATVLERDKEQKEVGKSISGELEALAIRPHAEALLQTYIDLFSNPFIDDNQTEAMDRVCTYLTKHPLLTHPYEDGKQGTVDEGILWIRMMRRSRESLEHLTNMFPKWTLRVVQLRTYAAAVAYNVIRFAPQLDEWRQDQYSRELKKLQKLLFPKDTGIISGDKMWDVFIKNMTKLQRIAQTAPKYPPELEEAIQQTEAEMQRNREENLI